MSPVLKRYNGSSYDTVGQVAVYNSGPAAVIGYAEVTASQGSITTEVDLTGLTVTVTVPAGRRLRISGYGLFQSTVADDVPELRIKEGATLLNLWTGTCRPANINTTADASVVISPTAGTHTYKLTALRNTGSGTVTFGAAPTLPAYIMVEDITGSTLPYNPASVPVGAIGQAYVTSNVALTTTRITIATLNLAVPAGRLIRLSAHIPGMFGVSANQALDIQFFEGATMLQESGVYSPTGFSGGGTDPFLLLSPSAGAHVYSLTAALSTGTGSIFAGTDRPIIFLAEDITPTPSASTGAPGSTLGYAQVVANQAGINLGSSASPTDLTGLSATVTVPAGRRLRITGYAYQWNRTAGTVTYVAMQVREGSTELQRFTSAIPNTYGGTRVEAVVTPSAGSHTYKLSAYTDGTVDMAASATTPAFILVEDITGSVFPAGTAVTAGMVASEQWTDYTPTLTQSATVTKTVTYARYQKLGRLVFVQGFLLVSGAGTASNNVVVGLPGFAPARTPLDVGTFTLYDSSAASVYKGSVLLQDATTFRLRSGTTTPGLLGTTDFTAALASGDEIQFSFFYESTS